VSQAGAPLRRVRWYDVIWPQALSLGLTVAAGVGIFFLWKAEGGAALAAAHLQALSHDFLALNLFMDFSNLLLVGACLWVLARVTDPALPARLGALTPRIALAGIGVGLAVVLFFAVLEYLSDTYLHTNVSQDTPSLPIIPHHLSQLALGIFTAAILAPLAEEAYFRGVLMGWFARHFGKLWAIAGSALVFGFLHLKLFTPGGLDGIVLTAELVLMGAVLGVVATRTRSLWGSFFVHATNTLCAVLASVFLAH
jgi:membrane protease YdiL (CAAX protease family)